MSQLSPFWTSIKNLSTPGKILRDMPADARKTPMADFLSGQINNAFGIGIRPRGPAPVSRFKTVMDYSGGALNTARMSDNFQNDGSLTQIFNQAPGNQAITNTVRGITNDPLFRAQMLGNPNLAGLLPLI